MKIKLISTALACALAMSVLGGCAAEQPQSSSDTEAAATAATAATAASEQTEVTSNAAPAEDDAYDPSVYFLPQEEAVKKMGLDTVPVSAVGIGRAATLTGIDAGINMIGIPNDNHFPEEYLESITHITNEEGEIEWALIAELSPSVILIDQKSSEQYAAELEELNIPVYIPAYNFYDGVLGEIGLVSSAFGTNEAAAKTLGNYNERILDMLSEVTEEKTVALLRITADGYVLYAGGNYADSLISTVNIKNIAGTMGITDTSENSGMVPIELTDLIAANPDAVAVMITVARDQRDSAFDELMEEFSKEEYQTMNAVMNQKIVRIDHHPYAVPGMLPLNGIESVFSLVYE